MDDLGIFEHIKFSSQFYFFTHTLSVPNTALTIIVSNFPNSILGENKALPLT